MPRARISGYIAVIFSLAAGALFVYYGFFACPASTGRLTELCPGTYYAVAVPIAVAGLAVLGAGFWIGWKILTIKVVPPMPDLVEKKDFAKVKALVLCLLTLTLAAGFIYGIYLRSFWALAVPAAVITLVFLGMIFWVGLAIVTTRKTLPEESK